MIGAIRSGDILFHPVVTIRCFGWRIFFKAIFPWHSETFLSLLQEASYFESAASKAPDILRRCIELELRARRIYTSFAKAFADYKPISGFFADMARQEEHHAELLEVCRIAAQHGSWKTNYFRPWDDSLPALERQMDETEARLCAVGDLDDALRTTLEIESSALNEAFAGIVMAADSSFVRTLGAFQEAVETHIGYICQEVPKLAPHWMLACRDLRARLARRTAT
jgi:rubrerythrin